MEKFTDNFIGGFIVHLRLGIKLLTIAQNNLNK